MDASLLGGKKKKNIFCFLLRRQKKLKENTVGLTLYYKLRKSTYLIRNTGHRKCKG